MRSSWRRACRFNPPLFPPGIDLAERGHDLECDWTGAVSSSRAERSELNLPCATGITLRRFSTVLARAGESGPATIPRALAENALFLPLYIRYAHSTPHLNLSSEAIVSIR
jgi:hypothetical protein